MPRRNDINSILIIGAGPIVIGQACEFDYSGTQACKALKADGYRIVLVNSNPATIMTDPDLADATYIEPITPEIVAKIIEKERNVIPGGFALLPTMGGQTALNCALSLRKQGTLEKFGVQMIGATADAIDKAEDRELFREAMTKIGLATPRSHHVKTLAQALEALEDIGLPAIIRPSFTLGGTGGGIAYNKAEFIDIVERGIDASPTNEVLIEESVLGWKEFEMEVVRDKRDNCIIVCSIENIDPMGVHTGDSITIAPALTLTDKEYQIMRDASIAVLREIGVETGGSNVQFAVNPADGRLVIIEMNPRVSRSSALASKATGFPIAKIAAKLAVGYTLDELQNEITGSTPASFEPTIDYVVTKMPRFTFEKFPGAEALLSTSMKSVGEAMSVGRSFAESVQKALRSMETGLTGFNEVAIPGVLGTGATTDKDAVRAALARPTPDRYSSYGGDGVNPPECEAEPSARDKVIILGGGPNRIGQGIEFDYCCVHAAYSLKEAGYETIMVNCNPETVSTDYDTSDRLYFEPLTLEDVLEIVHAEEQAGPVAGVICSLGGQTPLGLAQGLKDNGVTVVGTSPEAIHLAEDRGAFGAVLADAGLPAPKYGMATSYPDAQRIAAEIGYPVMVRPSYVLGGRGMEIVYDDTALESYIARSTEIGPSHPVLVDRFIDDAVEIDV